MTPFETVKIGFALALLGVVFTVHPIVSPTLDQSITFPWYTLPLRWLYYSFVSLLVGSVYFFALDMLAERPRSPWRSTGTWLYAGALMVPPVAAALAIAAPLTRLLEPHAETVSTWVSSVVALLSAVVALRSTGAIKRTIAERESVEREMRAQMVEADHVRRAREMLTLGHFDLAALEAWSAVEVAMRTASFRIPVTRAFSGSSGRRYKLLIESGVIPEEIVPLANQVRSLRNQAAHGGGNISKDEAQIAVDGAVKILGSIKRPSVGEDDV